MRITKHLATSLFVFGLTLQVDGCSTSTVSKSSSATADTADSGPSGPTTTTSGSADGNEEEGASTPQPVSGAYLVDCGYAGSYGYGCVIDDPGTTTKTKAQIQNPTVTVTYADGSTSSPTVTTADPSDPWSLYFIPPASKATAMTSILVSATIIGAVSGAVSVVSQSLTFIPNLIKAVLAPPAFAANTPIVFVTSAKLTPGIMFSSKAQADMICKILATGKNSIIPQTTTRSWAAMLAVEGSTSTGTASPGTAVNIMDNLPNLTSISVAGTNGATIGAQLNFAAFNLLSPIGYDETGNAVAAGDYVWTGAAAGSVVGAPMANSTCSNWKSSTGQGAYGVPSLTSTWSNAGTTACSNAEHLYCAGY